MKRFNSKTLVPPVVLFLVCLTAYLPLCTFRFALKNDAFIYNFPNKFFFSEALHASSIPLWNPYLNYGFPLYADPGFAWWHPITWIFGLIGYNPYTFTIEVLLYIYLSGLSMYWLGRTLRLEHKTAFAMGCMFMCSGFFIGNLQHINFITCAAFLPWVTSAWLQYQKNPSGKNTIWCGIAVYLLCTGGHPAIPIAAAYFFLLLTVLYYLFTRKQTFLKPFIVRQFKFLGCCLLFLLPLILSYAQLWPYYSRSLPVSQTTTLSVGFTLPSYLSFVLPFGTIKNAAWFGTDVSMRNAYFSLGGFLLLLHLLGKPKQALQVIFLLVGVFMLLLAAGGWVKSSLYQHLPAFQFIRNNGEFRVFAIFSFIVCVAFGLNELLLYKEQLISTLKSWIKIATAVLTLGCLILLFYVDWNLPLFTAKISTGARIKFLLDHLSFYQTLLVSATIALLLALLYLHSLYQRKKYYFIAILTADLIINSWLLLPITGVSQHSVAEMQAIISKSPKGFPPPMLRESSVAQPITSEEEVLIGNWNWYSRQLIYSPPVVYPSMLHSTAAFLQSEDTNVIKHRPFVFLKHGNGTITLTQFRPNIFELLTKLAQRDTLVLLQNWYPGWKALVNKQEAHILFYQETFMQLPLTDTTRKVKFRFSLF